MDYSINFFVGIVYLVFGMFAVSLAIAAPLMILSLKFQPLRSARDILGMVITLIVTFYAFDAVLGP